MSLYDQEKGAWIGTSRSTHRVRRTSPSSASNKVLIGIIVLMVLGAGGYLYHQHGHEYGFDLWTKKPENTRNNTNIVPDSNLASNDNSTIVNENESSSSSSPDAAAATYADWIAPTACTESPTKAEDDGRVYRESCEADKYRQNDYECKSEPAVACQPSEAWNNCNCIEPLACEASDYYNNNNYDSEIAETKRYESMIETLVQEDPCYTTSTTSANAYESEAYEAERARAALELALAYQKEELDRAALELVLAYQKRALEEAEDYLKEKEKSVAVAAAEDKAYTALCLEEREAYAKEEAEAVLALEAAQMARIALELEDADAFTKENVEAEAVAVVHTESYSEKEIRALTQLAESLSRPELEENDIIRIYDDYCCSVKADEMPNYYYCADCDSTTTCGHECVPIRPLNEPFGEEEPKPTEEVSMLEEEEKQQSTEEVSMLEEEDKEQQSTSEVPADCTSIVEEYVVVLEEEEEEKERELEIDYPKEE